MRTVSRASVDSMLSNILDEVRYDGACGFVEPIAELRNIYWTSSDVRPMHFSNLHGGEP